MQNPSEPFCQAGPEGQQIAPVLHGHRGSLIAYWAAAKGWAVPTHVPGTVELQNRSSQVEQSKPCRLLACIKPRQIRLGRVPLSKIWMNRQQWARTAACLTPSVRRAWTQLLCPKSLVVPAVPPRCLGPNHGYFTLLGAHIQPTAAQASCCCIHLCAGLLHSQGC